MVTGDKHQGRRVAGQRALGGETYTISNMFDALRLIGAIGFPFEADTKKGQTTLRTLRTLRTFQTLSHWYRNGPDGVGAKSLLVTDDGTEPSILGQLDGLQQSLTAQVGVTVLVGVIYAVPTSVRRIDERTMSAAPPAVRIGVVVDERIIGTVFPRSVDALRASHHHHVASGRSCRTPFGIQIIIVFAYLTKFRSFEAKTFGGPILGIHPSGIDLFKRTWNDMQTIVGKPGTLTTAQEEPTLPIIAHHMTRVNVGDTQINRLAPRAVGRIGRNDKVHAAAGLQVAPGLGTNGLRWEGYGEVYVVLTIIFANIRSPDRAQEGIECCTDRLPMHKVATMEDDESWHVVERTVRHIVIITIAHDGGVGIVTSEDRIGERTILCLCGEVASTQNCQA